MMPRLVVPLAGCALLLTACAQEADPVADPPAGTPSANSLPASKPPVPDWPVPSQCPDWADPDRPEGSNCHGITPDSCGADKAQRYVGDIITPQIDATLTELGASELRIVRPDQAINDDLREDRLNVFLDKNDRISRVDCF